MLFRNLKILYLLILAFMELLKKFENKADFCVIFIYLLVLAVTSFSKSQYFRNLSYFCSKATSYVIL